MKKLRFASEWFYILGLTATAAGVVLMEKADFGVSMVVAPAYILYRALAPIFPFVTFGMAEYVLQGILIVLVCCLRRRFRISYLFSFVTAVFYGWILDAFMRVGAILPTGGVFAFVEYGLGMVICAAGISSMFHTYLSPEAYELFVKEISHGFGVELHRFKTFYDCGSLLVSVVLSFLCFGFGRFVGIGWGTLVCALINGHIIAWFSHRFDSLSIYDAFSLRSFFTGEDSTD